MIQANELRIGNWVSKHGEQYQCGATTILMLEREESDVQPIPITEEWLLRFGYTLNEFSGLYIFRNEVELHYNSCDFYLCEYGDWNISINYVHELQNAYYFLIGQELTIKKP